MHFGGIDGGDSGIGVSVGGQQGALGLREQLHRFPQHIEAGHLRHALIGQGERQAVASRLELLHQIDRAASGIGSQDAVVLAILAPQIAFDRAQNFGFIIHCDNCRCWHWNNLSPHRMKLRLRAATHPHSVL